MVQYKAITIMSAYVQKMHNNIFYFFENSNYIDDTYACLERYFETVSVLWSNTLLR